MKTSQKSTMPSKSRTRRRTDPIFPELLLAKRSHARTALPTKQNHSTSTTTTCTGSTRYCRRRAEPSKELQEHLEEALRLYDLPVSVELNVAHVASTIFPIFYA
ncbi:hypothetical protein C8039_12225 [Halogeometricum sp. wsp3]|nr:hypothetical protein C8039_12225 [Halogeometricum sp. wsp3]